MASCRKRAAGRGQSGESAHDQRIVDDSIRVKSRTQELRERREWAGLDLHDAACRSSPATRRRLRADAPRSDDERYDIYYQPEVVEEAFKREKAPGQWVTTTMRRARELRKGRAHRIERNDLERRDRREATAETSLIPTAKRPERRDWSQRKGTRPKANSTRWESLIETGRGRATRSTTPTKNPDGLLTEYLTPRHRPARKERPTSAIATIRRRSG